MGLDRPPSFPGHGDGWTVLWNYGPPWSPARPGYQKRAGAVKGTLSYHDSVGESYVISLGG